MHKHIFTLGLISASLCTMTAMAEALPSYECSDVWTDKNKTTPAKMVCADCCSSPDKDNNGKIKCLNRHFGNCWLPPAETPDETYFGDLGEFKHSCSIDGNITKDGEIYCDTTILFSRAKNGICEETGYMVNWITSTDTFIKPSVGINNYGDHISYIGRRFDGYPNAIGNFEEFKPGAENPNGMDEEFGGQWILNFTGVQGTVNAKMYGTSACATGNPGKLSEPEKTITHDAESGVHCWCKVTGVGSKDSANGKLDKPWTYVTSFSGESSGPSDCSALCARACATDYADEGPYGNTIRSALFKAWWEKENKNK